MRNQVSSNFNKRNDFRRSGKLRGHGGFTLAELLIVIAVILILAGFGFVNVIENQRRLRLREMDDIARQIFIAAQNHLTVAEASGQWDYEKLTAGKEETLTDEEKEKINNRLGPHNKFFSYYEKIQNALEFSDSERKHDYRVITSNLGLANGSAIDTILPFGAIDETLKGRRFIILYDAKTATINGVYYSEYDEDLNFENVTKNIYKPYIFDNVPKNDRRGRLASAATRLIGWYGPGDAEGVDDSGLYRPIVTVENAENLVLKIVDRNIDNPTVKEGNVTTNGAKTKVKISYRGLSSNASVTKEIWAQSDHTNNPNNIFFKNSSSKVPRLDAIWSANKGSITNPSDPSKPESVWNYSVYLDSVTVEKGHFADIFTNFIPGEDIEISVSIVYENGGSSKESKAAVVKTNSLFGSLSSSGTDNTVTVANGRHLQNLSYDISHVGYKNNQTDSADPDLSIPNASINYSITWNDTRTPTDIEDPVDFIRRVDESGYCTKTDDGKVCVYNYGDNEVNQGKEQFSSIRNKNLTSISGNMNDLINFDIVEDPSTSGAGLVAKSESSSFSIENLKLINPKIEGASTNTGAFVGTADNSLTLTSCAAYNAAYKDGKWGDFENSSQTLCISSSSGSVGGLVGSMKTGSITNSVASLYVNASGTGNAGGLVGTCTGTVNIKDSYAGGHTAGSANSDIDKIGYYEDVPNKEVSNETARGRYNVISTGGSAGGLIGSYTGGTDDAITITRCYSTASASGASAAGGLIGMATGTGTVAANNSYCTGRVGGSAVDAKKGQFIGTGTLTSGTGNLYFSVVNNDMKAIGGVNTDPTGLTALDANLTTYNDFVSIGKTGTAVAYAKPYDGGLTTLYDGNYALQTIKQLGGPSPAPTPPDAIPEWLTTHYGDWPAPETLVVNVPAGT